MLLFGIASLVVTPAALAVSRHFEHEADRFGSEITVGNQRPDGVRGSVQDPLVQSESLPTPSHRPVVSGDSQALLRRSPHVRAIRSVCA